MPLNQSLYSALVQTFKQVKVAKEGQPLRYVIKTNHVTGRKRAEILEDHHGEEYRVCCPFCTDDRYRLWINHRWNTEDEINGVSFGHLINCFNDGCDLNRDTQSKMRPDKVEDLRRLLSPLQRHTVSIRITPVEEKETIPRLPEKTTPVDQLEPWHSASKYLSDDRGFDRSRLVNDWTVLYCEEDKHPFVDNRIIVPVQYDGKLVGWQARHVGECPKQIPKYFTMPGMRKKRVIYNFDRAKSYTAGVIVEGVTDVWTLGFQGIAMFGAEVSPHQLNMMVGAWGKTGVILLPDGDVLTSEEKKVRYERLRRRLLESAAFKWGVLEVMMPESVDPAMMSSKELWNYILHEARRQGYQHEIFCEHAYSGACRE
jgi:hypothetical protein